MIELIILAAAGGLIVLGNPGLDKAAPNTQDLVDIHAPRRSTAVIVKVGTNETTLQEKDVLLKPVPEAVPVSSHHDQDAMMREPASLAQATPFTSAAYS